MTQPVFFAEDLERPVSSLRIGEEVRLGGKEGRHAGTVRRILPGQQVDIVDGCGMRLRTTVCSADKEGLTITVDDIVHEDAPQVRLVLIQALSKGGRDELAVETCSEIGVDHVIPWQSNRSIVRWQGPKRRKGQDKWESVVRAAAKQARRAWVPTVGDVVNSQALAQWVRSFVEDDGGLVLMCHEEGVTTLTETLNVVDVRGVQGVAVIVGPEGGIDAEECAELERAGARQVRLGRNVLRASTAGAVAATLIGAHSGLF